MIPALFSCNVVKIIDFENCNRVVKTVDASDMRTVCNAMLGFETRPDLLSTLRALPRHFRQQGSCFEMSSYIFGLVQPSHLLEQVPLFNLSRISEATAKYPPKDSDEYVPPRTKRLKPVRSQNFYPIIALLKGQGLPQGVIPIYS